MAERTGASSAPPPVADADVRARALRPDASFIVQAPAGSGKTELLIQRLLVLLARVEEPEQVLAITFTRKAAAEMRGRLLEALAASAAEAQGAAGAPTSPHEAATRERARAVLAQDRARGWALLESPARLRIQTIDSLCAALTRARPLRSGLGEAPAIADDPAPLYQAAARATLAELEGAGGPGGAAGEGSGPGTAGSTTQDAMERLLLHLDDNHARVEGLLCAMLARRDQWLRHALPAEEPAALRAALEAELRAAVTEALAGLRADFTALAGRVGIDLAGELAALLPHAARHAGTDDPAAPLAGLTALAAQSGLPPAEPEALASWQALAELLTTRDGAWRRALTKAQGFPTDKAAGDPADLKAVKEQALDLLAALGEAPEFAARLRGAAELPPPAYTDAQWAVLSALLTLLPLAVRHLRGAFAESGETDYAEVALAALRALESAPDEAGEGEARHILVDEFQDTSHGQFRLLEGLTAHWPGDGSHTLFLVGDPMQSIYRFREAEVGLFLRARSGGIGALRLEPLTLKVNFRSTGRLVSWVNEVFPGVLAKAEDAATGAVPFSPATAVHGAGDVDVTVHPLLHGADEGRVGVDAEEAARVVELIAEARRQSPAESVAVLVRTRGHLAAILPALQRAGLPFQAVDIEGLAERPEVQDLLMLTRALAHPGDRVAWLAVLRAPWCGLELAHLLHVAGEAERATLWERITDGTVTAALPPAARARVERVVAALGPALAQRERRPLRRSVEGAWLALGGPACVPASALTNVEAYLARLETLPAGTPPGGPEHFAALLERLYAAPDPAADARLQVMSIHRAKGLQFDTVIVPGLGRVPRADDPPLLRWMERPAPAEGGAGLLLAPIHEAGPERDPLYDWLGTLERQRAGHETGRLLYVAVTRARRALHLLGHAVVKDGAPREPARTSLLARLWPALEGRFAEALDAQQAAAAAPDGEPAPGAIAGADGPPQTLRRLPASWRAPGVPPPVPLPPAAPVPAEGHPAIEFRWAGETARHVGTLVHRLLCLLARHGSAGMERWQAGIGAFSAPAIAAALGGLGVPAGEREGARARVLEALARTLADERGRWVLAPHAEARSEYALTALVEGRPTHAIIDRTFVDEAGVRWIVDFKTGAHEGGDREAFLAREQERYRAQLEDYAAIMARLDPGRPIRLALYFPLLQAWREWAPPAA